MRNGSFYDQAKQVEIPFLPVPQGVLITCSRRVDDQSREEEQRGADKWWKVVKRKLADGKNVIIIETNYTWRKKTES